MLSELITVAQWYKDEPATAWQFDECLFTNEASDALAVLGSALGKGIEFYSYSAKITVQPNHCYIPSQYFLYALKVKPLALLLRRYMSVFEQLEKEMGAQELASYIESSATGNKATDQLDIYSRDCFFRIFNDPNARMGAKKIFNGTGSETSSRGVRDFFSSIILKVLPIPNVSSDILGKIIYELTNHPEAYNILEKTYSRALPFLIFADSSDELLLRLFFILGEKDNFKALLGDEITERNVSAAGIDDLFLLSSTPVAGNQSYFDKPINYLPESHKFVHLRKGVMNSQAGLVAINNLLTAHYPSLEVRESQSGYILRNISRASDAPRVQGAVNRIYYGAPGTGKSYQIEKVTDNHTVFRTVFHPDTQYSDFVGCLKPLMRDGSVGYGFRAGPFTEAVINATNQPDQIFFLIIEEINRAPAAAVFGEIFQLLDRDACGSSIYFVDISDPDMLAYMNNKTDDAFSSGKLKIPSNLSLLATMNSSDQAVMPLDTAFKRRWEFQYLPIDYTKASKGELKIPVTGNSFINIEWARFAEIINDKLATQRIPEDRLLGHRFVSETELNRDADSTLKGKLFMYLWDDVLRHGRQGMIFSNTGEAGALTTFGQLVKAFEEGEPVFNDDVEAELIKYRVVNIGEDIGTEEHE